MLENFACRPKPQKTKNEKFLRMLHGSRGAVFSKSATLAAGGGVKIQSQTCFLRLIQ